MLRPNAHKKNTVLLTCNAEGSDLPLLYGHLIQPLWPGYGVFLRPSFKSLRVSKINIYILWTHDDEIMK